MSLATNFSSSLKDEDDTKAGVEQNDNEDRQYKGRAVHWILSKFLDAASRECPMRLIFLVTDSTAHQLLDERRADTSGAPNEQIQQVIRDLSCPAATPHISADIRDICASTNPLAPLS